MDRDDGRRLAFPAQAHVRVPVTAKLPVTRDAHGQWGVYPDDVDLSLAAAVSARDAPAAGDAGAAAVAQLLTFDGDERAYAEAAAQAWAVRSPTAELPASDQLMPPPALKGSGVDHTPIEDVRRIEGLIGRALGPADTRKLPATLPRAAAEQ